MNADFLTTVNCVSVVISGQPIEALAKLGGFDAVVSSDDSSLSMDGGVSRAIRVAGGHAIVDEARKLAPVRVGDVAVTSAGRLPVGYVLHAVTLDLNLPARPSELTIRLLAENVFRRCELLGVHRLVMPALGTGIAQFSPDRAAILIIEALAKHSASPTTIEEVVFSLPGSEARHAFVAFLNGAGLKAVADTDESTQAEANVSTTGTVTHTDPRLDRRNSREGGFAPRLPTSPATSRPLVSNRYVLLEELGRGGMAIVYLAWDIVLRQIIAIKTLQPGEHLAPHQIERLRREAALQIGLVHHGIVRLLNFEPWDSSVGPYIIMEYVPWTSGDRWLADVGLSRLPLRAVLTVGLCLCEALAYAHSANVLHGDIKPSNVFVDPAGTAAKLADFGIARVVGGVDRNALVTKLVGPPRYMAPEQKTVGAQVGPRTDLYLLAGTLADFVGASRGSRGEIEFPYDVARTTIGDILQRALALDPADRPQDATEFARLLRGALVAGM